ncbi:MAG: NADH pyrophosphatase [Phenylobacterium sp. RIFCSPHIGHO2_01_FULL_69_31]|uniref:NAD(+) diphosphatase n=1 Tax=Phenylobacterium sp. RIFCSPHIGHO2_01_FULL_69_31 TaxID=1801944 RepID=UPI0008B5C363|nr:NAD(+) diphosphatase [Phenylobacterium sp. RIFCSPHIGHO2_01_FULL_69_31]OHB30536.1 MAG: NADH pyrophosphatase [Phenylobacterium sp. RIFCSPHIGHO2_01_FULL_69_31]
MALSFFQNTFAGNPLNRASDRRGDAAWLAAQLSSSDALGLVLWNGKPLAEKTKDGGVQIAYLPAKLAAELAGGNERLLFMGLWQETAVFAVDMEGSSDPAQGPLQGLGEFMDLRQVALRLPAADAGILATAKSMFEWRRRHQYCAVCGQPSEPKDGGWKRQCPSCEAEHFPRTDPVVIMLAYHGERCMLGRQEAWPPGMFSALAGFLEPGESIEEACARELGEEAGLRTRQVRYHSTQPWPYPSSLMIGLIAEVEDDEGTPDQTELSEVRWFTREEARKLLKGEIEGVFCPPPLAIAHQLLKGWADEAAT